MQRVSKNIKIQKKEISVHFKNKSQGGNNKKCDNVSCSQHPYFYKFSSDFQWENFLNSIKSYTVHNFQLFNTIVLVS